MGAVRPHRPPSAFDWLTLVVALAACIGMLALASRVLGEAL